MPIYSQFNRPLRVKTPLGDDAVLPVGFAGTEGLSQLFSFDLELLAPRYSDVDFSKILGQSVTVELSGPLGETRYFNGIVRSFEEGMRDNEFTQYKAQIVPQVWLATQRFRSRIFQQKSVPEILATVFEGVTTAVELSGTYYPRNYCVQYQETDFDFASRLMEEEGIFYYFRHEQDKHTLVLTDGPYQLKDLPDISSVIFDPLEGGLRETACIFAWRKRQEICSSQVTLWDYTFELPGKNLEAQTTIQQTVQVGQVSHKLPGTDETLEIYEFPGRYAQRYDGIDPGGAQRSSDLQNIYTDNMQTAKVAIEAQAAHSLDISGQSNIASMCPGLKFTLERHPNADGKYLLVQVEHRAELPSSYRSDVNASGFKYENRFTCLPDGLPFRPRRVTPRPRIAGLQTATVVGPSGDQLFLDTYGRVKVQFHWDREGKFDGNSSCWLRVAQPWAGQNWGAFFWPRIGHEVLVSFLEGDPDRPVVVGSVYNAHNMPPLEMPKLASACGFKSCSVGGDPSKNFNCMIFYDAPGDEHVHIHSETHQCITSETANFQRTYGPKIEVYGVLPAGIGGGGGGGEDKLEQAPYFGDVLFESSGGGGGILDWVTVAADYCPDDSSFKKLWKSLLPGTQAYYLGSVTYSTLFGDNNNRVFCGSQNCVTVDPEAILLGLLPGGFKTGVAAAILSGLGGSNTLTVGPGTCLQYFDALNVRRGKEFSYETSSFFTTAAAGKYFSYAAKVMVALTAAIYLAGDLCAAIMAAPTNSGDNDGEEYPTWATLLSNFIGTKSQALLQELEKKVAEITHAEQNANHAVNLADQGAGLLVQGEDNNDAVPQILDDAERRIESGMDAVIEEDVGPEQVQAENNLFLTGNYNRYIFGDITLISSSDDGSASATNVWAMGGGEIANNGIVDIYATQSVIVQAGMIAPAYVSVATSDGNGSIAIVNSNLGPQSFIHIRQGPPELGAEIKLTQTPPGLTMNVLPGLGPQVQMTEASLTLSIGESKLVMTPFDMTLTVGAASIAITNLGVTINGQLINIGSGDSLEVASKAQMVSVNGSGMVDIAGGLISIG